MKRAQKAKKTAKDTVAVDHGGVWGVEILPNVASDALRCFGRLDSCARANAVTREHLQSLVAFPKERQPGRGRVYDKSYERVADEAFFLLRISDDAYEGIGDVCVFFAAIPCGPKDGKMKTCGRIVVLGLCWWKEETREINKEIARNRYEQYVKRKR